MTAIVSDTHAFIWYLANDSWLSRNAEAAFESASVQGNRIYMPTICLVEATYLVEKGRITQRQLLDLIQALEDGGSPFEPVDLTLQVAQALGRIPRVSVPDLPDRVIAATALALNLPLVTRDERIRTLPIQTIW
jgi:PIN domain nuclease of toxin-antitoxin system